MSLKKELFHITERNPFSKLLGMELLETGEGYAKGRAPLKTEYTNVYGGMHGGCSYALADTLAGIAAATYGNYTTTVNGSLNYLLPIKDTEYVYCEAKAVRQGGKVGVYEVLLTNDNGELLCTGTFTYYRLKEKIQGFQEEKEKETPSKR